MQKDYCFLSVLEILECTFVDLFDWQSLTVVNARETIDMIILVYLSTGKSGLLQADCVAIVVRWVLRCSSYFPNMSRNPCASSFQLSLGYSRTDAHSRDPLHTTP